MADLQRQSEPVLILGGIGVIALVAYLATRKQGNVMQPTAPASVASQSPVSTNTLAMDTTALSDPLLTIPSGLFGGTPTMPGQFVQLPSGSIVPFTTGTSYELGSIIHYADGSVQIF